MTDDDLVLMELEVALKRRQLFRRLAKTREKLGLSQATVAERMRISEARVAQLEGGDTDPRVSILERYIIALGKEPAWRVKPLKPVAVEEGSGNVFADIGFRNPEQVLAKAKLVNQIEQLIRERKLPMPKAAELIGVSEEQLAQLLRGRFTRYPINRLRRFISTLEQQDQAVR